MPEGSVPLLIALIVLVLLSGFFSAAETAFSCASRIKLRALAGGGNKRAAKTLDIAENKFDKLLSTILVGNNIVNITTATLATVFFTRILSDTSVNPSLIATIVVTLTVLIFGEITPKFFAAAYPEKFAMNFYPLTVFFFWVLYVFNVIFGGWKWLLAKIFRIKDEDKITEEEIMTVVEEAEEDGTIRKDETRLIRSVIEFDDVEVGDILVPRVNIVAVDVDSSMEEIKKVFDKEGYSRLPVYRNAIDTSDDEGLNQLFSSAKDYRDSLPLRKTGVLGKAFLLYSDLRDEAGQIATVATILANNGISIKNIGIIHNREFEEGVLAIELYNQPDHQKAGDLLSRHGYILHKRN